MNAMSRTLSFVTAGGAATAGFLGCCMNLPGACLTAGILALFSLVFNLWDFSQHRIYTMSVAAGEKSKPGASDQTGSTRRP